MYCKKLLDSSRVRKIEGSFSWIDHRFITGGFLQDLSTVEILVYLFLVAVSDRHGISFYHDDRICSLLKIGLASLGQARDDLIMRSLIAYESPLYQVLSLPPQPIALPSGEEIFKQQQQRLLKRLKKT
jgi:hypothetical protein